MNIYLLRLKEDILLTEGGFEAAIVAAPTPAHVQRALAESPYDYASLSDPENTTLERIGNGRGPVRVIMDSYIPEPDD